MEEGNYKGGIVNKREKKEERNILTTKYPSDGVFHSPGRISLFSLTPRNGCENIMRKSLRPWNPRPRAIKRARRGHYQLEGVKNQHLQVPLGLSCEVPHTKKQAGVG